MKSTRILIADDDHELTEALAVRARQLNFEVRTAKDGLSTLQAAHEFRPDVICLDVNMPCGNGLSVCEMLADDKQLSSVPVIVMTGMHSEHTIRRCCDLRAYYVPKRPDLWNHIKPLIFELLDLEPEQRKRPRVRAAKALEAVPFDKSTQDSEKGDAEVNSAPDPSVCQERVRHAAHDDMTKNQHVIDVVFQMLGADADSLTTQARDETAQTHEVRANSPPWVLHIDDDADLSLALKLRFEKHGIAVVRAFNGMEGYRTAFTHPADAIILDFEMPNGHGDYVLRRLKENPVTRDIPVIVLTGRRDMALQRRMFNLGAASFLTKPISSDALLAELQRYIDVVVPADA